MELPEEYRGIEFIRISSLPSELKEVFQTTFDRTKIIKILREKEVLVDCILYKDFLRWREERSLQPEVTPRVADQKVTVVVR
jgi:hypothetical protein